MHLLSLKPQPPKKSYLTINLITRTVQNQPVAEVAAMAVGFAGAPAARSTHGAPDLDPNRGSGGPKGVSSLKVNLRAGAAAADPGG